MEIPRLSRYALTQCWQTTIGTLLAGLDPREREDLYLIVYIANTRPEEHPLYGKPLLQFADSTASARDVASPSLFSELVELEQSHQYVNKTAYDFSLALRHCFDQTVAPYIMLFEDDIVAADGWLAQTRSALHDAEAMAGIKRREWLDVRLFNDAKNLRWREIKVDGSEWHLLWVVLPPLLPSIMGLTYLMLKQARRTKLGSNMYTMQAARIFCLVSIPLFALVFINTGYLVTMPQPDGLTVQSWGCCTQGEVFPRARVPFLVDALQSRSSVSPADLTVWDFATENGLLRFVMNPPVIQHAGSSSILTPDRPMKETVWSMAFEDWDAGDLRLRHEQLMKELYYQPVGVGRSDRRSHGLTSMPTVQERSGKTHQ